MKGKGKHSGQVWGCTVTTCQHGYSAHLLKSLAKFLDGSTNTHPVKLKALTSSWLAEDSAVTPSYDIAVMYMIM